MRVYAKSLSFGWGFFIFGGSDSRESQAVLKTVGEQSFHGSTPWPAANSVGVGRHP